MKIVLQLVFTVWLMAISDGQATPPKDEKWPRGRVELRSGLILSGDISYNWKAEIVQLRLADGSVKAYSAFQVSRFVYFDAGQHTTRLFAFLDFPVKATLHRRLFLEEYAAGPLMVYRRLRHRHEPIRMANPAQFGDDELPAEDLDEFVYYVFRDELITDLDRFERELWPRMKAEFGTQLHQYQVNQRLDTRLTLAKILLIGQYNALKSASLSASAPPEFSLGRPE